MPEIGNLKTISEMSVTPEINKLYPELVELRQKLGTAIGRMGEIQEAGGSGARYASIRDKTELELIDLQYKIAKEHPELAYRKPKPRAEKGKGYEVTIREMVTLPYRKKPEPIDKVFTIHFAKTKKQAIKAVKSAGYKGEIVGVRSKPFDTPSVSKRGGLGRRGTPRITPKTPRLRR